MQGYFTCDAGYEDVAAVVQEKVYKKLVSDLHHEARLQCIINHAADVLGEVCHKDEARKRQLTKEEYLARCLDWGRSDMECWEAIVDRWLSEGWESQHDVRRDCRLQMVGPPHHQGNLCLDAYAERWVMIFGTNTQFSFIVIIFMFSSQS
jgi:hypothetical protein